jgi:hypothetical protein
VDVPPTVDNPTGLPTVWQPSRQSPEIPAINTIGLQEKDIGRPATARARTQVGSKHTLTTAQK